MSIEAKATQRPDDLTQGVDRGTSGWLDNEVRWDNTKTLEAFRRADGFRSEKVLDEVFKGREDISITGLAHESNRRLNTPTDQKQALAPEGSEGAAKAMIAIGLMVGGALSQRDYNRYGHIGHYGYGRPNGNYGFGGHRSIYDRNVNVVLVEGRHHQHGGRPYYGAGNVVFTGGRPFESGNRRPHFGPDLNVVLSGGRNYEFGRRPYNNSPINIVLSEASRFLGRRISS